ncbi:MAG: phosphoribosylformylglycinamidine cyclo-ligase, partial [Planctomycetales bacterium]|nr:phosphoribosylformylglycinamidine cyclo-ligase [Planctomycetales bacterium]
SRCPGSPMSKLSYKAAGVDLEKYQDAMQRLPAIMHRTLSPRVMKLDGGFAGLFQLDFPHRLFARQYREPVLVACTDGVGTKLNVASRVGRHDTVGIDLVAMCVNDAICCGAEPLFFLDYIAMGQDDPALLEQIVQGVGQGCLQADCALLGGETAIMPDLYQPGDYDMAGFCVGVVERRNLIDGKAIDAGDLLLGIGSNGIHSNGYSLVRKIVFEAAKLGVHDRCEPENATVGDVLLRPTQIYASVMRAILDHYKVKSVVHGIAHITGGGLHENLTRILPPHVNAQIRRDSWECPPVFDWLQRLGDVEPAEMERVFNMGLGLVLAVSPFYAHPIQKIVREHGLSCWEIGEMVPGQGQSAWAT